MKKAIIPCYIVELKICIQALIVGDSNNEVIYKNVLNFILNVIMKYIDFIMYR